MGEGKRGRPEVAGIAESSGVLEAVTALDPAVRAGEVERMPDLELALRAHIDHEDNGLFPAAAVALAGGDGWGRVHALTPAP